MKTNFHTHNYRCKHAKGNVEDYVKVAIREGYTQLGISDHAPFPEYYSSSGRMEVEEFEGYLREIEEAREKYKNQIKIYKSVEIEYFPEASDYYRSLREKLDYIVLGLHSFRIDEDTKNYNTGWSVENDEHVLAYGKYMSEAIASGYFDYVAHPDLYMVNYKNWTEACEKSTHLICRAAEKYKIPLEVNANGIRKTLSRSPGRLRYFYPYREFWEIVAEYDIPVIIGSDTHNYEQMEDEAMELAREFAAELNLKVIDTIF